MVFDGTREKRGKGMNKRKTFLGKMDWEAYGVIAFYAYFAINILMKAFCYDHGTSIYKCFLVIAMMFWMLKVVTTRYSLQEVFKIAVIIAVGLLLAVVTKQNTWLFLFLTIVGMKNCRFRVLIQMAVGIRVTVLSLLVAGSAFGIYDIGYRLKMDSDYVGTAVYSFAMNEPNTAFLAVFLTLLLLLYYNYERLNLWWFLGTSGVAVAFYKFTFCRTGVAVFFFCWALIVFEKIVKNKSIKFLLVLSVPVGAFISLVTMLLYNGENSLMHLLNHFVSGRIYIMNTYYLDQGISLFPRTQQTFYASYHGLIDNAYMFVLLYGGVLVALFFFGCVCVTLMKLYRSGCYKELVMIGAMALYGVLEQFIMNGFMNPFILLCGILLYPNFIDGIKSDDNKKKI